MLLENYYENLSVFHVGTEPNRAFYIPCSKPVNFGTIDMKSESDRILLLNGDWNFRLFNSIEYVPENVIHEDYWFGNTEKLAVPAVWQYNGYDRNQYINVEYPIPYDPPYVPNDNPCGVYFRDFNVTKEQLEGNCYINFEGVDSCFYLWINGNFVGYSQVSHSTHEFNIKEYLSAGKNNITVIVLKWCDGTYFEDQDKFRTSGILRDVYLMFRSEKHIRDYKIITDISDDYSVAQVNIELFKKGEFSTEYTLEDKNGNIIAKGVTDSDVLSIKVENPMLWNAETPNLYYLTLNANGEYIHEYIGIRKIYIKDGVVYLNGQNIKFRGVNRHDSHPEKGPVVNIDDMLKDMRIMKQHNVNAIRTSHYPNAPIFPIFADYYGFYLIAEADLESHGVETLYGSEKAITKIAEDKQFEAAIIDRQDMNYHRDKNRPSVVFWSLGNESGWGCNFEKAAEYMHQLDRTRLTHYESVYFRQGTNPDYSNLDVRSRMYNDYKLATEYCEGQKDLPPEQRQPFVLCEYCHAMGNSPGDLEFYFQLFYKHDCFCGGFVWEWCDHAVTAGKTEDGKVKYLYGGDSGEAAHDGNFCMDGLVYPDRRVSNSLLELKNVNRPVRIQYENGKLKITNHLDFLSVSDSVQISWEITECGERIAEGVLDNLPEIMPHQTVEVPFEINKPIGNLTYIMFYMKNTRKLPEMLIGECYLPLVDEGHLLGFDQQCLTAEIKRPEPEPKGSIEFSEDEREIVLCGRDFTYRFDKIHGVFYSIKFKNKELLLKPMEYNIWRAPTDNDKEIAMEWRNAHYNRSKVKVYGNNIKNESNSVIIESPISISADGVQKFLDIVTTWKIDGMGNIVVDCKANKNPSVPMLPRFGFRMFVDKDFESVEYFGKGPCEAYIDKQRASWYGKFESTVTDMHEDYIKPQENGSHFGTEYVTLSDNKTAINFTAVNKPFSFSVSHYTQEALEQARHNYELVAENATVMCIDYAQNGIGSRSCGPKLMEEYQFNPESFEFRFALNFSEEE